VDSVDVERDVREHIEKSLCEAPPPVDLPDLTDVLDRLGSPSQWVPDEELSWGRKARVQARRVLSRLRSGPEDFRLAYLSIALFALALLTFAAGAAPLAFFLGGFSFLFARASLAAASTPQELGAQRWLLYPILIVVYLPLALALLLWTVGVTPLADLLHEGVQSLGRFPFEILAIHFAATCTALWWFVLGLVLWRWPGLVRNTFYPFTAGFRGRHGLMLSAFAFLILVVALVLGGLALAEGPHALRVPGG
jgi:hypothetical protein